MRQPKEYLCGGADHVVELVKTVLFGVSGFVVSGAKAVITRGNQCLGVGIGQLVPGQLFENEAVKRLVAVESADDIIPVAPHVGLVGVALVAVGIGIAHQVKPVAG